MYSADIQKLPRQYVPADFMISNWEGLALYFEELYARDLADVSDRKSTRLNSSHVSESRMPSSA